MTEWTDAEIIALFVKFTPDRDFLGPITFKFSKLSSIQLEFLY